MNIFVRSSHDT